MKTTPRGYKDFAEVYDLLSANIPYDEIADYYDKIIRQMTDKKEILDIGCGTGNLTARLARRGYSLTGADASEEMLSRAYEKSSEILWIHQDMRKINLGRKTDVIISTLDSISHLESEKEMLDCFKSAAANLKKGGAFIFDVNTIYKHKEVLKNNTFVYDVEGVYCVWSNEVSNQGRRVDIDLDIFFEEPDGSYTRGGESFCETAVPEKKMREMLTQTGFETVNVYDYLTFDPPKENSEKLLFAARKL